MAPFAGASTFEQVAEVLKALGHPLRLRVVALLAEGPAHVGALADRLGAPQPITSQQLRILRMAGLVEAKREGGQAIYRLREPRLHKLLQCMALHPNQQGQNPNSPKPGSSQPNSSKEVST